MIQEFDKIVYEYYNFLVNMEPIITNCVNQIITGYNVEDVYLESTENCPKSKSACIDKCTRYDNTHPNIFYIYDVLRYTIILPHEDFYEHFRRIKKLFEEKDFRFYRIKNTWNNYDRGIPYKGINTLLATENGLVMEIQLHTKESYAVNLKTHKLYEELLRIRAAGMDDAHILNSMLKYVDTLQVPENINKIDGFSNENALYSLITNKARIFRTRTEGIKSH